MNLSSNDPIDEEGDPAQPVSMFPSTLSAPLTFLFLRPKFLRSDLQLVVNPCLLHTKEESSSFLRTRLLVGGSGPRGESDWFLPRRIPAPRVSMPTTIVSSGDGMAYDVAVAAVTAVSALALLRFWDEIAKRGVFDQILNRKLVHISVGLVFMLYWPLFSPATWASYLAAFAPAINVVQMILIGMGILKNEAMIKSMSRHGDRRELLKGPLYYACTITIATAAFWRTSPVAISAICNLCAGDGIADIVGRRFGTLKLPYNTEKSFAGTLSMFIAGFLASIGYMYYFSSFGLCDGSWSTVVGLLIASLIASIVESLPISTEIDDNLTVPLTSLFVGCLLF